MNTRVQDLASGSPLMEPIRARGGLLEHLDPAVFGDERRMGWVRDELRSGNLVIISDAFDRDFAEGVRLSLESAEAWRPVRRYDERAQFCRESMAVDRATPRLGELQAAMSSVSTRRWVGDLSGMDCEGEVELEAQCFLPGHYSNMDSGARGHRTVAALWHLSKGWDARWGGDLVWHLSGSVIQPSFNTMYMFRVDPKRSPFSVSPVIPAARGKRLSIACWWSGAGGRGPWLEDRASGAKTAVDPERIDDEIFTLRSYHDVVV